MILYLTVLYLHSLKTIIKFEDLSKNAKYMRKYFKKGHATKGKIKKPILSVLNIKENIFVFENTTS